jgi:hypothetical protein
MQELKLRCLIGAIVLLILMTKASAQLEPSCVKDKQRSTTHVRKNSGVPSSSAR